MIDWASLDWNLARAGGFVAYLLLSASVLLGLTLSSGWRTPDWPRFVTRGVHEQVTLAALVFTAAHGLAIWLDPFLRVGLVDVLVPLSIPYRPLWVGLGIIAGYAMLALWLSERIRPLIGYRAWRALHFAGFGAYLLATAHGLASGTDTGTWWAFATYAVSGSGVVVLLAGRLVRSPGDVTVRAAFGAAATAIVVGGGAWALRGPLQPDWGPAAGSRTSLTGAVTRSASPPSFDAAFNGSERLSGDSLVITGSPTGRAGSRLEIDLQGRSRSGTFSVRSGRIVYSEGVTTYSGDLASFNEDQMQGTLTDSAGDHLSFLFTVTNIGSGGVSGTLAVHPA